MEGNPLSPREATVLHFIAWGFTNKEIACLPFGPQRETVEAHKANGMRKLKIANRHAVVRYAVENGWLALDTVPQLQEGQPDHFSSVE